MLLLCNPVFEASRSATTELFRAFTSCVEFLNQRLLTVGAQRVAGEEAHDHGATVAE